MSLKIKIVAIMGSVLLLMVLLNIGVLRTVILPQFQSLEREEAMTNMERVSQYFANEVEGIGRTVVDWSHWDSTFYFAKGQGPGYVEDNLSADSMSSLGMNLFAIYDAEGALLWGLMLDANGNEISDLERLPDEVPGWASTIMTQTEIDKNAQGLIGTPFGYMLFGAEPILDNEGNGPSAGAFVMARLVDETFLDDVRAQLQIDFDFRAAPERTGGTTPVAPSESNAVGERVSVEVLEDTLLSHSTLTDATGAAAAVLTVRTPRDITRRGGSALEIAAISLLTVGLADMALMWVLISVVVLRPVSHLREHVERASQDRSLADHAPEGNDEIGRLGRAFNDLSRELKAAQADLVDQSYKAGHAEMAASALHNIRNAMNPLINRIAEAQGVAGDPPGTKMQIALDELAEAPALGDRQEKLVRYCSLSAAEIGHWQARLTDVLDKASRQFSRIKEILVAQEQYSHEPPVTDDLDLREVIDEAVNLVPLDPGGEISIVIDPSVDQMAPVRASRLLLVQVLQNLVTNAIEAVEKVPDTGRKIVIACEHGGASDVQVVVQDQGVGIAPADLQQIFRSDYTTKTETQGGLGLHWCSNTVNRMNGRLYAESDGPGHGAQFHLVLPQAA